MGSALLTHPQPPQKMIEKKFVKKNMLNWTSEIETLVTLVFSVFIATKN